MSEPSGVGPGAYDHDVGAREPIDREPAAFVAAVEAMRHAPLRPEVGADELPPPRRIAPYAYAMTGDVTVDDDEIGTGRFVLLHDPAGQDAWEGTFRCVTFARADIDPEMAADPVLPSVGWSWLVDALAGYGAEHAVPSGSVTVVRSEGFGDLDDDTGSAQVELRASWTPVVPDGRHAAAWSDLLCTLAGLPPLQPGVIPFPSRRGQRG